MLFTLASAVDANDGSLEGMAKPPDAALLLPLASNAIKENHVTTSIIYNSIESRKKNTESVQRDITILSNQNSKRHESFTNQKHVGGCCLGRFKSKQKKTFGLLISSLSIYLRLSIGRRPGRVSLPGDVNKKKTDYRQNRR